MINMNTTTSLPSHLIRLPGQSWALWRWVCLRGAGFPAHQVLDLATPDAGAEADRLLAAEDALERTREQALATLRGELDRGDRERRFQLLDAIRQVKRGKAVAVPLAPPSLAAALEAHTVARDQLQHRRRRFEVVFADDRCRLSRRLRQWASDRRFREALLWQNRSALRTGVEPLLRKPATDGHPSSKQRQHEQLVAAYLQRYCTKNDTIGFFGPVGWARWSSNGGDLLTVWPGADLVAERSVFLEGWCVDAVAQRLAEEPVLRPWWPPRRAYRVHLEGSYLCLSGTGRVELSAVEVAVFGLCDGQRSAVEVAQELLRQPGFPLAGEEEVYATLDALVAKGAVVWELEVPVLMDTMSALRRRLEKVGDEELRRSTLERLRPLEAAREEVARAAGDPEFLAAALQALDARFTELTGAAPTRAAGQTYAGRTLVFEDCRRDLEVELGPELLRPLAPPLALVLTSTRWYTFEIARRYGAVFTDAFRRLQRQTGASKVGLLEFCAAVAPVLFERRSRFIRENLQPEFQARWARLLPLPEGERRVRFSAETLAGPVEETFAAPAPGWAQALYQSPDVLIAAESVEAIQRGELEYVLGEVHLALNTMRSQLFVQQHPRPEELLAATELDLPRPRAVPMLAKKWHQDGLGHLGLELPRVTPRLSRGLIAGKDFWIGIADRTPAPQGVRHLALGELVVTAGEAGLVVKTRDGRHCFELEDFLESALSGNAVSPFPLFPDRRHTPRVNIDRLVVARETWRFAAGEVDLTSRDSEAGRFLAAQRWARRHGMPRFVFIKVPGERKPFFVDFTSPLSVEILVRGVRRLQRGEADGERITVTEMLPHFDHLWLPDAQGRRYASELRFAAVDLTSEKAAWAPATERAGRGASPPAELR